MVEHNEGVTVERLSPQQELARKKRGQWLALSLFAFVIIVFFVTIVRLGASVLDRSL